MNTENNTQTQKGNVFTTKILSKKTILKMQRTEILEESEKLLNAFCSERNELFKSHLKKITINLLNTLMKRLDSNV